MAHWITEILEIFIVGCCTICKMDYILKIGKNNEKVLDDMF
jgi:hypothetical protein